MVTANKVQGISVSILSDFNSEQRVNVTHINGIPLYQDNILPVNPYTVGLICSGNCERTGTGLHWSSLTNCTFNDDITRGDGTNTLLFDVVSGSAGATPNLLSGIGSFWNAVSERYSVYFETLPSGNILFCHHTSAGGISQDLMGVGFHAASGQIRIGYYNTFGGNITFDSTGIAVTTSQWYDIDFGLQAIGSTFYFDAQVDGVPLPQFTRGTFLTDIGGPQFGYFGANVTQKWRLADYYGVPDVSAYPIGTGFIRRFNPQSDGTHNTGAAGSFIVGTSGANITNATTDSHLLVDDLPLDDTTPDTDDYITQTSDASGASNYVEHVFGSPDGYVPTVPPTAIDVITSFHQTNTGTGNGTSEIHLNDNGVEHTTTAISGSGSSTRYSVKHYPNPPSTGLHGWSLEPGNGNFNNLRIRSGYSSDGNPDQSFDGYLIEAFFKEDIDVNVEMNNLVFSAGNNIVFGAGNNLVFPS